MYNSVFRVYRKLFLFLLLLVCAVLFWFYGCRNQQQLENEEIWETVLSENEGTCYKFKNENLEGTISVGLLSNMTKGHKTLIDLTLGEASETFAGTFIVTLPGEDGKGIAYQFATAGEKGQERNYHFEIPYLSNASYFQVQILNQYNEVLLSELVVPDENHRAHTVDKDGVINDKLYIGILTSKKDDLNDLKKTQFSASDEDYTAQALFYHVDTFPQEVDKLKGLSALIIDDFDTASLSESQRDCIYQWVIKEGGCLYLGTGACGSRVLNGMQSFLGLAPGEVNLDTITFRKDELKGEKITLNMNQLVFENEGLWEAVGWSSPEIFYKRNFGKGSVRVFSYCLLDSALRQWNYGKDVNRMVLSDLVSDLTSDQEAGVGLWYIKNALFSFMDSKSPNTFFYGIIFILYLLCLGFFGYHVLRRNEKREFIWVSIPLISLVFFVFIVFHARVGRAIDATANFSVVKLVDNIHDKRSAYFLYQNAEGESKSIRFNASVDEVIPMDYEYVTGQIEASSIKSINEDIMISDTLTGYDVEFREAVSGHTRVLKLDLANSNENGPFKNFKTELNYEAGRFSGTITNDSAFNFKKLILINGVSYKIYSDIAGGSTIDVNSNEFASWTGYDEDKEAFGEDGDDARTANILEYIKTTYLVGNENGDRLIMVGVTDDEMFDLFSDHTSLHNQITLVAEDTRLISDTSYHRISDINLSCMKESDEGGAIEDGTILISPAEISYQFDSRKLVWELSRSADPFAGSIYAYNYVTRGRDRILSNPGDSLNCQSLEPYVTPNNGMQLTFELEDGSEAEKAPVLSMILKDIK